MDAKRAYEIAEALVPADLYGFVRNGRHGWRALKLALEFLAEQAADLELRSPRGERIVFRRGEVEMRPIVGASPDTSAPASDAIVRTPIGYGDQSDRVARSSYALGGVVDAEYAALVGRNGEHIADVDAWDHIFGYMKLTPATRWQGLYLCDVEELHPVDDADVYCELADAIGTVSSRHPLMLGDIVRTGTRRPALVDLTNAGPNDVLERLLTHADG